MFDSEDFDLDEDFLNDIGQKEEEYYSQKIESEKSSPKRRKIEDIDFLSDASFDDEPDFAKIPSKSIESVAEKNENGKTFQSKISRENNLQTPHSGANESNSKMNDVAHNFEKKSQSLAKSQSVENVEISRRKLALEILRRGSGAQENVSMEKNSSARSSPLMPLQSLNDRNSRLNDEPIQRKTLQESFKKPRPRVSPPSGGFCQSNSHASSKKFNSRSSNQAENVEEQTRRKTLLESFKKPYPKASKSAGISRVTRARKFPGPAGLLPDSPEPNFESGNFLNRLDCGNIDQLDESEDSGISEYFSQTTEKFFIAGAWQSMLDDLPEGFLRGHEIATIKKTAKSNSRVSLLAGVISRIDHSRQNPRLILKDLSDSIEATMHPDILLAHPNIFEPGVVVLLRHVGVLGFQTSPIFPTLQFHVMIAPKNVGAVYSEKSRIVTSPWMESILLATEDSPKSGKPAPRLTGNEIIDENSRISSLLNADIDVSGFESEDDDVFASFTIEDLGNSQNVGNSLKFLFEIPAGTSAADKIAQNLEITGNIAQPEPNLSDVESSDESATERRSSPIKIIENSKESSPRAKPKKTAASGSQIPSQLDPSSRNRDIVDETHFSESRIEAPAVLPEEMDKNPTGFGDNLMDSDNDTEDEILSQLDVDSIVTTYNSQT